MSEDADLPVVLWPISCFDRTRENPFPVYNRWYWLDWSRLTPEEVTVIRAILQMPGRGDRYSPNGFGETVVTMSFGLLSDDRQMLRYRRLFMEVPGNNIQTFMQQADRGHLNYRSVSIGTEYFENEAGTPITKYEMIQYVSGQEQPIIVGDPESILHLGSDSPINRGDWTQEKANMIAQFLDVIQRILSSKWYKSPTSITALSRSSDVKELLEATFPGDEATMSVLAYFRQLHGADRLLVRSIEAYLAHCGQEQKIWWINERKRSFETLIDSPPVPFDCDGQSRRNIIRMYMYGAGLLHSNSERGDGAALHAFVTKHGTYEAILILNSCLLDILRIAVDVYKVIRQDFRHWVEACSLDSPTRFPITKLFAGYRRPNAAES